MGEEGKGEAKGASLEGAGEAKGASLEGAGEAKGAEDSLRTRGVSARASVQPQKMKTHSSRRGVCMYGI